MKTESNLEKVLRGGNFAVTAEIGPPQNANPEIIKKKARMLKEYIDAFNVTDGQTAVVRMASWAACSLGKEEGLDPIVQMTCRDRNRIALQMDVLGVSALDIHNILCLTGDHQSFGNHPEASGVYDIDSVQFIKIVKNMRDEKKFQCGDKMSVEPRLFIGAAANPFAEPFEFRTYRLAKKVNAGADFIQTQMIFNVPKFRKFMERVRDRGVHEHVHILAGVGPIRSLGAARYMSAKVPGMDVPDEIVERIRKTPKKKRTEEGIKICVEVIQQVREIEGVSGVHIMSIEWEEVVPQIVEQAGLLPRPSL